MTEVQLYAGVKMSASATTDLPPNSEELQRVWLWDCGPAKPMAPKRPAAPKGKEGDPEYDLAKVEFAEQLEDYATALKSWKQQKQDYAKWQEGNGGPIEIVMWSCDAADALARDEAAAKKDGRERRFYVSSRTRGHSGIPNRGLPEGVKPGHGQAENERRQREGDADLAAALKADPVFGQQELRA